MQRSGATPFAASTTTSPARSESWGKAQQRKDMTAIAVAHHIPYVAQAAATHWHDLSGWGHEPRLFAKVIDLAVECLFWPLYEVVEDSYRLTYEPEHPVPVVEWLALQERFAHLLRPENTTVAERVQAQVEQEWAALVARC